MKIEQICILATLLFFISLSLNAKNLNRKFINKGMFDLELEKIEVDQEKYYKHLSYVREKSLIETNYYTDINLHRSISALYVGYIFIGNPSQIIGVVFDSGSGYTWVASEYCIENSQCRNVDSFYQSKLSTSHKNTNVTLKITFGTGELVGNFCKDVIALGPKIILLDEPIGEIVKTGNQPFIQGGVSGVVGFAYNTTSTYFNHTIFDGLVESKTLSRNVISFLYNNIRGVINFGYIDANNYQGELVPHKVVEKYYWTVNVTDLKLNNESIHYFNNDGKGVVDTGSTALIFPPEIYQTIIKKMNFKPDCSGNKQLPTLNFVIDNTTYSISPEDYVFQFLNIATMKIFCELNIIPIEIPKYKNNGVILGTTFIRKYYTVFDRDNDQVYFGNRR